MRNVIVSFFFILVFGCFSKSTNLYVTPSETTSEECSLGNPCQIEKGFKKAENFEEVKIIMSSGIYKIDDSNTFTISEKTKNIIIAAEGEVTFSTTKNRVYQENDKNSIFQVDGKANHKDIKFDGISFLELDRFLISSEASYSLSFNNLCINSSSIAVISTEPGEKNSGFLNHLDMENIKISDLRRNDPEAVELILFEIARTEAVQPFKLTMNNVEIESSSFDNFRSHEDQRGIFLPLLVDLKQTNVTMHIDGLTLNNMENGISALQATAESINFFLSNSKFKNNNVDSSLFFLNSISGTKSSITLKNNQFIGSSSHVFTITCDSLDAFYWESIKNTFGMNKKMIVDFQGLKIKRISKFSMDSDIFSKNQNLNCLPLFALDGHSSENLKIDAKKIEIEQNTVECSDVSSKYFTNGAFSFRGFINTNLNFDDIVAKGNTFENGGIIEINKNKEPYGSNFEFSMKDSTILDNSITNGASIRYQSSLIERVTNFVNVSVENTNFHANKGNSGTSILVKKRDFNPEDSILFKHCQVINSTALRKGSGIFAENSNIHVIDSIFTNNFAGFNGSSLYVENRGYHGYSGILRIDDSSFSNSKTNGIGGQVVATGLSSLEIKKSNFVQNQAFGGGALAIKNTNSIDIDKESKIENNVAVYGGGILIDYPKSVHPSSISVDALIQNNDGNNGGGVYFGFTSFKDIFKKLIMNTFKNTKDNTGEDILTAPTSMKTDDNIVNTCNETVKGSWECEIPSIHFFDFFSQPLKTNAFSEFHLVIGFEENLGDVILESKNIVPKFIMETGKIENNNIKGTIKLFEEQKKITIQMFPLPDNNDTWLIIMIGGIVFGLLLLFLFSSLIVFVVIRKVRTKKKYYHNLDYDVM